jgi:hypothetical protein
MKIKTKIEKEVNIVTLKVQANVRYWEDSEINGISDENGDLVPFRKGDLWCPQIDIETGIVNNWPKGTKAEIHYKVCDQFSGQFIDENGETVIDIKDEYVPNFMSPKESGFGDYIIMDIDENGKIEYWDIEDSDFFEQI